MENPRIDNGRANTAPEARGYCVVYRDDAVNHCPGCGRTHWYVGRLSAQCGFCETALPLAAASGTGMGAHRQGRRVIGAFEPQLV
jgi:hypothetical protein